MTLIFVRHGESEGNVLGVAQGWADYALTKRGRRQAEAVADHLAGRQPVALYSSDLVRAVATADVIASRLGLSVERREGLREQCFGERQGLTWEQCVERWGDGLVVGDGKVPGEEQTVAFRERVAAEFEALSERHREDVVVCVAHGGTILAVVAHVLGLDAGHYPALRLANGSLTVVEVERGQPAITALNHDRHLRGLEG